MTDYRGLDDTSDGNSEQAAKEVQALGSHEEDLAKVLVRMEKQKLLLRWGTSAVGLLVLVAAGVLEWLVLRHIMDPHSKTGDLFVVLAVSPIAAITLIVIFALIGVFRGYRGKDMAQGLSLECLAETALSPRRFEADPRPAAPPIS